MEEALDRVGSEGKEGAEKGDDVDLREHMVGILFSRSKLTHLQKQASGDSISKYPSVFRRVHVKASM